MAALAGDLDLPIVDRGHHLAGVEVEFSFIEAGNVVHAEDGVDGEALEEPVLDHRRAALLVSSPGWKISRTVPLKFFVSARCLAAPSSMVAEEAIL